MEPVVQELQTSVQRCLQQLEQLESKINLIEKAFISDNQLFAQDLVSTLRNLKSNYILLMKEEEETKCKLKRLTELVDSKAAEVNARFSSVSYLVNEI